MDWGGGPSYGVDSAGSNRGGGRDYSLLSPAMPRKGSVVKFDVGEPGVRRHSSPIQPTRRKNAVVSTMESIADSQPLVSVLKYCKDPPPPSQQQQQQQPAIRYVDDYRTLTQLRKRSAGDQSIISIAIDEDDSGEEEEGREEKCVQADDDDEDDEDDEDSSNERTSLKVNQTEKKDHQQRHQQCEATADELEKLKKRRASLKRNHTDDSDVEQRMERIFHEINYSVTDSVDDLAKFNTSHSSAETAALPPDSDHNNSGAVSRVEVETQTICEDEQVSSSYLTR